MLFLVVVFKQKNKRPQWRGAPAIQQNKRPGWRGAPFNKKQTQLDVGVLNVCLARRQLDVGVSCSGQWLRNGPAGKVSNPVKFQIHLSYNSH